MIELLQGAGGGLQAILGWLLVLYPVVTLPLLLGVWMGRGEELPHVPVASLRDRQVRRPQNHWGLQSSDVSLAPWADPIAESAVANRDREESIRTLAPQDGVNLEQLLDVLEAANRIETLHTPRARTHLREVASQSRRQPVARKLPTAHQGGGNEVRTLRAAHRVAGNPRMQGWIRNVARDLLERTGSDS
jgi:hypothetical protein